MIRDTVAAILKHAVKKTGIEDTTIPLAHPADPAHGDYATSIALKYAKKRGVPPIELAQHIADNIQKGDVIESVEVVKPGFINVFLANSVLTDELKKMDDSYPEIPALDKKALIEFGQPNTHKLPHIGHLFSYIFGESLSRIYEQSGYKVKRANYQGDIGLHVAKCLWYVVTHKTDLPATAPLKEKIEFLQKGYQEGSEAYDNNEDSKKEIDAINKALYHEQDDDLMKLWKDTREWCIEYYDAFQTRLGIKYDRQFFETETWKLGKELVEQNTGTVFEKSQNAVIFRGEEYGLHTRVFINKHGNPTYEGKELGLYEAKRQAYAQINESITTTASEQNEYFKVVFKAIEKLYPEQHTSYKHLGYGMINLTTGKMSSRTGEIVGAFELVEITKNAITDAFEIQDPARAETIAIAAVKYSFLKSDPFKNMTFDLEKSITREGDSGPYLLYTYVRTRSILKDETVLRDISLTDVSSGAINTEEKALLRLLSQYPEAIEQAKMQYSPSVIATYLFTLAQSYNLFYQKHSVLKAEESEKPLRISLTQATGTILKSGLHLLGIETVEKM